MKMQYFYKRTSESEANSLEFFHRQVALNDVLQNDKIAKYKEERRKDLALEKPRFDTLRKSNLSL